MREIIDDDYREFVADLKRRVAEARATAARVVNRELILLYWDIGAAILEKQRISKWGDSVTEQIASDLRDAFPDSTGFSGRNLRNMKRICSEYGSPDFWQQAVAILSGNSGRYPIWQQAVAKLDTCHPGGCDSATACGRNPLEPQHAHSQQNNKPR